MGKAHRHPQLLLVLGAQLRSHPLAKRGRAAAQVHRHIEDRADGAAHELALGLGFELVVEAAQYAAAGAGVVVLAEGDWGAHCFIKVALIPALEKEAPLIAKHLRCDQQRTFNYPAACCGELLNLHDSPQDSAAGPAGNPHAQKVCNG